MVVASVVVLMVFLFGVSSCGGGYHGVGADRFFYLTVVARAGNGGRGRGWAVIPKTLLSSPHPVHGTAHSRLRRR